MSTYTGYSDPNGSSRSLRIRMQRSLTFSKGVAPRGRQFGFSRRCSWSLVRQIWDGSVALYGAKRARIRGKTLQERPVAADCAYGARHGNRGSFGCSRITADARPGIGIRHPAHSFFGMCGHPYDRLSNLLPPFLQGH